MSSGDSTGLDGGAGDILRRTITWRGDEPSQVDTCLGNSSSLVTSQHYGYDYAGQLATVDGGYPLTGTGMYGFQYDARGNRSGWTNIGGANNITSTSTLGGGSGFQPDMLTKVVRAETLWDAGSAASERRYTWDQDGRISSEVFDGGGTASSISFSYLHGVGTTFYSYNVGGGVYYANIDAFNRRSSKTYPSGSSDVFRYDLGHQMLEDQGLDHISTSPTAYPIDQYIWLGGRPVVVIRGEMNTSYNWQDDTTASCGRNDDTQPPPCGFYFPVTDQIGAPVLVLNSARQVTAQQDYDAFGYVNRGQLAAQVNNPHMVPSPAFQFGLYKVPKWSGYTTQTRTKFSTNVMPSNTTAQLRVTVGRTTSTISTLASGTHQSPVWTSWGTVPGTANPTSVQVWLAPGSVSGPDYIAAEAYEFRRYQASYYSIPLRFPGQYYDFETDMFENWNRYYEPQTGRYLSPEPLLQYPLAVQKRAMRAQSLPTYSYALNDPLTYTDRDGFGPEEEGFLPTTFDECIELAARYISDYEAAMLRSLNKWLSDIEKNSANCSPEETLAALRDAEAQYQKNMRKLTEWKIMATRQCSLKFPEETPGKK